MKLKGIVNVRVVDKNGKLKEEKEFRNLIVNAGKQDIIQLLNGNTSTYNYIAIGTGTTAASSSDSAMETEVDRQAGTVTTQTTTFTNDTHQVVASFSFSASYAITEYGMFNASTGGTMLSHIIDTATNVSSGDSMQVTWKIIIQ